MSETFTAPETRRELLVRLAEAMTNDDDLAALVDFLRDDLAYAPTNDSIIGSVLRQCEFEPWRNLMSEVRCDPSEPPTDANEHVRELSRRLLRKMKGG
jgi:hypothetical protein